MRSILESIQHELWEIFDHLHHHPEISWEEVNTTEFLKQQLVKEGYRVQTFSDCTGVVGEIGSGPLTVALRADMDALWQEMDGVWKANHSCGHDAHMTMALGVIKLFNRIGYRPPGTLKILFQPAEETGTGALKMMEKGVIDDVDFLYGVHLRPIQELRSGYASPAILHGAAQIIDGEIKGVAAHAARPHLGVNAIEVGSALVQELSKIHIDPQVPASIKMTRFHAGGKSANIIPEHADFTLDLRAQTNETMKQLVEHLHHVVKGIEMIYGAEISLEQSVQIVAANVHPEAQKLMEKAIVAAIGQEKCALPVVTSGGEDFHFYSVMKPALKTTMLGLGCDLAPGLHHPHMTFRREDLLIGVEILARTIMETFRVAQAKGESDVEHFAANN